MTQFVEGNLGISTQAPVPFMYAVPQMQDSPQHIAVGIYFLLYAKQHFLPISVFLN
jgi:hypothetical protein